MRYFEYNNFNQLARVRQGNSTDHLGSTALITNETGGLVEETTYEPFGKVYAGGSDRFLYTGKERDKGTGLEYCE